MDLITKYCAPTKFDIEPYGAVWRQAVEDNILAYYIQVSKDPEAPEWLTMALLLNEIYKNQYEDIGFIEKCLDLYSENVV